MTWVYEVPFWAAVLIFVGGFCLISGGGLALVQRYVPRNTEFMQNDVSAVVVGSIGTILAVLLSFMVVTVWQQHDEADQIVDREAAALADVYYASTAMPPGAGEPLRADIQAYLSATVTEEWALMHHGGESERAARAAAAIVHRVQDIRPKDSRDAAIQANALALTHNFFDQRRNRLFYNRRTVPWLIWCLMIFVAAMMLGLSYFFNVKNSRAHMIMTVCLGAVIGATFLMIAELDVPYRGAIQVSPQPFIHVQESLPGYRR